MAQTVALKKGKQNKRGSYSKHSKKTLKRCEYFQVKLASNSFLPIDKYMLLKEIPVKLNKLTPKLDKIITWEELEEGSDSANALDQACTSISDVSEAESKGCLPEELHSAQLHFTHHTHMESEKSSSVDNRDGVQDYAS